MSVWSTLTRMIACSSIFNFEVAPNEIFTNRARTRYAKSPKDQTMVVCTFRGLQLLLFVLERFEERLAGEEAGGGAGVRGNVQPGVSEAGRRRQGAGPARRSVIRTVRLDPRLRRPSLATAAETWKITTIPTVLPVTHPCNARASYAVLRIRRKK